MPGIELILHTAPWHHGSLRKSATGCPCRSWYPLVSRARARCCSAARPSVASRFASANAAVKSPRHGRWHPHPPGHRLRVAKCDNPVGIVPCGFARSFLELEAKVTPPFHLADLARMASTAPAAACGNGSIRERVADSGPMPRGNPIRDQSRTDTVAAVASGLSGPGRRPRQETVRASRLFRPTRNTAG